MIANPSSIFPHTVLDRRIDYLLSGECDQFVKDRFIACWTVWFLLRKSQSGQRCDSGRLESAIAGKISRMRVALDCFMASVTYHLTALVLYADRVEVWIDACLYKSPAGASTRLACHAASCSVDILVNLSIFSYSVVRAYLC